MQKLINYIHTAWYLCRFAYHDEKGSSGDEHHGDADLSHRVTATLCLSVHVRGTDKWTIVRPSRSDHRVTGSHRINPLLVWAPARNQKLSRKLLDDASLQEYTCCWHRWPEGGEGWFK